MKSALGRSDYVSKPLSQQRQSTDAENVVMKDKYLALIRVESLRTNSSERMNMSPVFSFLNIRSPVAKTKNVTLSFFRIPVKKSY